MDFTDNALTRMTVNDHELTTNCTNYTNWRAGMRMAARLSVYMGGKCENVTTK
jgi:hypothetical protein